MTLRVPQSKSKARGINFRVAKVESGCEAGEFKEFFRMPTGKNQAHRFMKVQLSEALFIFAALTSTLSVQSRFLQ